jgi:murein DD-endopeptidase MepM/ murein hydrolase activator NlpD
VVLLLALAAGGCSADLGRFDFPAAGYGPSGSTNAIPVPSQPMRRGAGLPADSDQGYEQAPANYDGRSSDAPAGNGDGYQGRYERDPRGRSRSGSSAAQSDYGRSRSGYDGGEDNDKRSQPPYDNGQDNYSRPQSQYDYTRPQTGANNVAARTYAAQAREGDRVAALTPPQREETMRPPAQPSANTQPQQRGRDAAPQAPARPEASAAASASGGNVIEVQQGDTLSAISRRYRVSIAELMKINNLDNPNLRPGQRIVLPAGKRVVSQRIPVGPATSAVHDKSSTSAAPIAVRAQAPVSSPPSDRAEAAARAPADWRGSHTVAQGESLYGIARKHGVKVAELQQINGIADVTKIKPGTVLKIPGRTTQATASPQTRVAGARSSAPVLPQETTSPLTVRPRIINSDTMAEPRRVASLGPGAVTATDASIGGRAGREQSGGLPETPRLSGTGKFRWPVKGKVIAGFGPKSDKSHNDGINISVPQGTEVLAAESGVVAYAGNELKGYGNLILIRHDGGWVSAYAHGDELLVKRGDKVKRGQPIAKAGNTGAVDQPQVHFELRQDSKPVDPMPHMERQ